MIRAFIFDLDGTLVETEELKGLSYARAATELRPDLSEEEVLGAFTDLVGLSRQEVAVGLMRRFALEEASRDRMAEFGVGTPWLVTREDVEHGKPDPEMHLLAARELEVRPGECLAIEDSPAGVQGALAAGTEVIAVTTRLTRQKFRETDILDRSHVVDDPRTLPEVVRHLIEASRKRLE